MIKDALYGFIIGDAMGVPLEFMSREELTRNPVTKMIGGGSHNLPKGIWSDDTSMTLATMDSISTTHAIDCDDIANRFCDWINYGKYTATNLVFGVGKITRNALFRYWNQKKDATKCGGTSYLENGNGSLMRMLPIAFYCYNRHLNSKEIYSIVKDVSSITHAHEISILGCYIYVCYILLLLSGKNKLDNYQLLSQQDYSMFSSDSLEQYKRILSTELLSLSVDEISSSGYIVSTLEAVLWVILHTDSFEQAIIESINLGNDTDTVGAITGSMAGILYGYSSIPQKWIDSLEGKDSLNSYLSSFIHAMDNDW